MGWSCRRPGCHHQAVAAIRFDAVTCQVWIDPLAADATQLLCQQHAERLSPPRGWIVVDRRAGQTVIVSADEVHQPKVPTRRKPTRKWGQLDVPTLEFTGVEEVAPEAIETPVIDPEPEPAIEPEPEPEPEPELVAAPEPEPESPADDLAALLVPKGGLLGRAFGATGDQKSALTHLTPDT